MRVQQPILFALTLLCVCSSGAETGKPRGDEFESVVVPIGTAKMTKSGIGLALATGFCLDRDCRYIGTNYHVTDAARPRKVKGQKVVEIYSATTEGERGGTVIFSEDGKKRMNYVLNRDLSILELRNPIRGHHGLPYCEEELERGQRVSIYAYPLEGINPFRKLLKFEAVYDRETDTGLLAFHYAADNGKLIHGGASGGIVVDQSGRIVGVLSALARNAPTVAMAVPVSELAAFVNERLPFLAHAIFPAAAPGISPVAPDYYPRWEPSHRDGLQRREREPLEVSLLRSRAETQAEEMKNFIAIQTVEWGTGDKAPSYRAEYEVRIVDGRQTFRELPDGKKELPEIPTPPLNKYLNPNVDWSTNVDLVAKDHSLRIRQVPDQVVNGGRLHIFQFVGAVEDDACSLKATTDWGFFTTKYLEVSPCYGEAWTDEAGNLLRISEHYDLKKEWRDFFGVTTYGPLRHGGQATVPLTYYNEVWLHQKKVWVKGRFTGYRVFSADHRLILPSEGQKTP
jgi:hypothetical protein